MAGVKPPEQPSSLGEPSAEAPVAELLSIPQRGHVGLKMTPLVTGSGSGARFHAWRNDSRSSSDALLAAIPAKHAVRVQEAGVLDQGVSAKCCAQDV